jgi:colanic acid biosynthesis glycosyl transferase WcaI
MAIRPKQRHEFNRPMRVLITGISYAPEETGIAPYTTGLAEHLVGGDCQVTVITGMPSYPQWQVYPEYRGKLRIQELRGGVDVRRVRNYVPRRQSTLRRGLYEVSFLLGGLTALDVPKPDVVFGVVPALSGGVLARLAAQHYSAPYGLIFQDLTGPAATQSGVSGGGRAARPISAVEGWVARGATAIGVIAEGFRPYLETLGAKPDRIQRVRNWMHLEEPKLTRAATREHLGFPPDAVVCLHAGNMGYKQGLDNIVECARLAVETDPRLLLVLMGDGSQRAVLVDLARRYQLPNLRFLPIQPAELFSSVLAAADVLLVNQRSAVTNMSLPGKLTSYFAAGRPVVAAVSPESETATEIHATGTGMLVPPDQPSLLLTAIRQLVADPGYSERLGAAGKRYARTTLGPDQALASLKVLVESAAGPRTARKRLPA